MHCHQAIHSGQFQAPASVVADWQRNVSHLLAVPTLDGLGTVVEQSWIENYLLAPHDLRPALAASMPKLPLSRTQARAIAAYLEGPPHSLPLLDDASASASMTEQRLQAGRQLFHAKGCPNCHSFEAPAKPPAPGANPDPARRLAPDLRWTRHRIRPSILVAWIKNPQSFRPDTLMPNFGLTHEQALNLASYVLRAELSPIDPAPMPKRLPILTRPVSYAEVSKRVLKKVCWHCHAQPDFAEGDGGPGMSGGFGFAARELDLSSYSSIMAGYRDRQAKWTSVFRRSPDGTPVLVEVLLRRQAEERGASASLRGMPLGLPALSPTEIQLVETWVAQGHPP